MNTLVFIQVNDKTAFYSSATLEGDVFQSAVYKTTYNKEKWQKGIYENLGKSFSAANIFYSENVIWRHFTICDNMGNCNQLLTFLKGYGYNFQNFTSSKNMSTNSNALMCGYPPNSNQLIIFITGPTRAWVSDNAIGASNGHCIYFATKQMNRSRLVECRGW